jgi:hypothetical protein
MIMLLIVKHIKGINAYFKRQNKKFGTSNLYARKKHKTRNPFFFFKI